LLDCFCKDQKAKFGFSVGNQLFTDFNNKSAYACYEWFSDIYVSKGIGSSISVVINLLNWLLKGLLVVLISKIGEDTRSAQIRSIKMGVFVSQFFNTAILVLLSQANFSESKVPLLHSIQWGQFTDFSEDWYRECGSIIIKTLAIASVMPVVEFCINYGL
jgi:hypothetical protein